MIDKTLLEDKKIEAPDTIVDAIDSFNLPQQVDMFSKKHAVTQTDANIIKTALEAYIYGVIDQNGLNAEINTLPNGAQLLVYIQSELVQPFLGVWKKIKDEEEEIDSILNRKDDLVLESDAPGFLDILQNTYTEDAEKISDTEHQTLQKAGIVVEGAPMNENNISVEFIKQNFEQPATMMHTDSNHVIPNITKSEPVAPIKSVPKPPKKDLYLEPIN